MLMKLIKHELGATKGIFLLLYGITATLILLCRALLYVRLGEIPDMENLYVSDWIFGYILVLIVGIVSTMGSILSAVRFYQSMTGDEAYLTYTLPAKPSQIIFSKVLVGFIWNMGLTVISLIGSALAFLGTPVANGVIPYLINSVQESGIGRQDFINSIIWYGIGIIFGTFVGMWYLMCIIAIGQMFGKYRLIGTIGTYFVTEGVLGALITVLAITCGLSSETMVEMTGNSVGIVLTSQQVDSFFNMFMVVYYLVLGSLSAGLPNYIFKKRLNLE